MSGVGGYRSVILRSGGSGNISTPGSAVIASMVFFKPFVTIPPLRKKQQRASTHEAMALMSFGMIEKWSTLAADWPDAWNMIWHVPDQISQHRGGFGLFSRRRCGC